MRYVLYLIFAIFLVGLHTAVLADLPSILSFYDIMIPFVVYFSLFRGLSAGLSVVLIIGFIMDMISGAPNGIYMATFMIVYLMFRNITAYFHAQETVLFTICILVGILIENIAFGLSSMILHADLDISFTALQIVVIQLIWGFLTGPLIYRLFTTVFASVDHVRSAQ